MAKVMYQMPEFDISHTVETNPELILIAAEDEEAEYDVAESYWLAGQAVKKPVNSND